SKDRARTVFFIHLPSRTVILLWFMLCVVLQAALAGLMPHCRRVKTTTLNMLIKRCDTALMVKDSRSAERTGKRKREKAN
ncbi:hypothetical protein, partial [Klebsiella aerogenes]|uniref:hypothetical protein n=1 Tax=Klebsiella aerogenes TaxID=548 RepID=UPI000D3DC679